MRKRGPIEGTSPDIASHSSVELVTVDEEGCAQLLLVKVSLLDCPSSQWNSKAEVVSTACLV